MKLTGDFDQLLTADILTAYQEKINEYHQLLHSGKEPFTGWVDYPETISTQLVEEILAASQAIQAQCTAFVVIGIGGSYLGAKACLELLQSPFYNERYAQRERRPKVYFAGHHLSSIYYRELFKALEEEEVGLCVISKSGTTLEPAVVFALFKEFMSKKYGDKASERIYVITDAEKGALRAEAEKEGYRRFVVPETIGGRYSVLSPVGLLPIAVAGIDIKAILAGAKRAREAFLTADLQQNDCYRYGLARHLLEEQGKIIEIFEVYEGKLRYFTEWLKQLFGESGCKDGKGIFPASLQMSTDLHSMGQFLQEGRQNFFETVVTVENLNCDMPLLPLDLTGNIETMHQLNAVIQESVRKAHHLNATPNLVLTVKDISADSFGEMVYFFEKACAISCYLDGVNPFDQPGVEQYKANIKKAVSQS